MKTSHSLLLVGIAFLIGQQFGNQSVPLANAQAEPAAAKPIGRYQISSFGYEGGLGFYMVDTATGEVWLKLRESKILSVEEPRVK